MYLSRIFITTLCLSSLISTSVFAKGEDVFRKDWHSIKGKANDAFTDSCKQAKKDKKHNEECKFIKFDENFGPGPNLTKLVKAFGHIAILHHS